MMFIACSIHGRCQTTITETGFFHCSHRYHRLSLLQSNGTGSIRRHHVTTYFIRNGYAILRNAVFIELHLNRSFLSGLINPVSMIGHGHPKYITPVRVVFRTYKCQRIDQGEQPYKQTLFHHYVFSIITLFYQSQRPSSYQVRINSVSRPCQVRSYEHGDGTEMIRF